jgi:hypothetical protein
MALAGICGYSLNEDFSRKQEPENFSDVSKYCRNLSNNVELSLPPFSNVSIEY